MIRKAKKDDLFEIIGIYQFAREYMRNTGNPTQWGQLHPPVDMLCEDVEKGDLYVIEENGVIDGVFALIFGDDPTYAVIKGEWGSDKPYATIHRIAARRGAKGVLMRAASWALEQVDYLRIDTHSQNATMKRALENFGFKYRGVIYVIGNSPRDAYDYIKPTAK